MVRCVWEYRVRPEAVDAFLGHYAPAGSWATLFAHAEGYLGTDLLRDRGEPTRFLTIDRWRAAADLEAFRAGFAREYEALDQRCEALTLEERLVGEFDDP